MERRCRSLRSPGKAWKSGAVAVSPINPASLGSFRTARRKSSAVGLFTYPPCAPPAESRPSASSPKSDGELAVRKEGVLNQCGKITMASVKASLCIQVLMRIHNNIRALMGFLFLSIFSKPRIYNRINQVCRLLDVRIPLIRRQKRTNGRIHPGILLILRHG